MGALINFRRYVDCQRPFKGLRMNTNSWLAMYDAGPTRSTCTLKIMYIQSETTASNICGVLHVKEIK
jgi:hypothetical protein